MIGRVHDPRPSFYALAAGLWLAGFAFALMPLRAYEDESFLMAVLCAGASVLCVAAVAPLAALRRMIRAPVVWLALGFWGLALISVLLSELPFVSFIYFCFFSVLPFSAFVVAASGGASALLRPLGYGLALGFGVLGVLCLVQYFCLPALLFQGLVSWPLANPNSLAGLLSLGFFASVGWMLAAPSRAHSNVALMLAAILFVAILTTGSRGALVALVPCVLIMLFFVRGVALRHIRCLSVLALLCAAGFIILSLGGTSGVKTPLANLGSSLSGHQSLLSGRPAIWAAALDIFRAHIWTGTGIGTFFLYYPEVRSPVDASSAGLMVHNDPLQFLVEMGVLAPLVFYAGVLVVIWGSVRALSGLGRGDVRRVFIVAPVCGLAAMVGHAHVSFHFHVLSILMVAGALFGFWFVQVVTVNVPILKDEGPYHKPLYRLFLSAPFLIVLAIFSQFQASEILVRRGNEALMAGDSALYAEAINRAGYLSADRNARALLAATYLPLGVVQLNAPFMPKDVLTDMHAKIESLLADAQAANPRLAEIYFSRAETASYTEPFLPGLKNRLNVPAELQKALTIDPQHLASRMKLADLALRQGDDARALEILAPGLDWRYKNQRPRLFLEKTYGLATALGQLDIAEKADREYRRYFPGTFLMRETVVE